MRSSFIDSGDGRPRKDCSITLGGIFAREFIPGSCIKAVRGRRLQLGGDGPIPDQDGGIGASSDEHPAIGAEQEAIQVADRSR